MVKNPDKSPEASAFVCKLALRLIEEGKMGLDPSYVDQISPDFWKGVAEQFEQLTMYSHLDQAGLPTSLVMTNGEQKRLLIQLQKLKINLKAGLAAKAYQLENVTASRISQEVDLRDPIYSSIFAKTNHNNEYIPVAAKPLNEIKPDLSSSDFQNSFLFLFEKARRCEYETSYQLNELEAVKTKRKVGYHPFDLELQTLWIAAKNNPSSQHMVQVLYIVRHYPELFQHQEDFTFQEISSIAKKVMDSIQSIEGKKRVQSNISASKAKESSPKEKIKLQFSASQSTAEEKPCGDLVKTYFTSKTEPVFDQNRPFALAMGQAQSFLGYFTSKTQPVYQQSSLARRLYDKMTRAFQELQTNEKVDIFTPKGAGLEKSIQEGMNKLKNEIEALKNQIEEVANTSTNGVDPALDHELLDAWRKGKTRISLQEVLLAVGTRNPTLLTEHNPFLAQKEIDQLQHLAVACMKKASKLDQLKEAAKAETPQDIATILNKTRLFDPLVWPELLFYEYSTGIMLRTEPNQAQLLIDMFRILFKGKPNAGEQADLRRICFEFQAGGGKTKVISAILAAKAMAVGKLPVFFSLPSLFDVVRQDLREMLVQVFKKNVAHMDINLQHTFDAQKMHEWNDVLLERKKQGVCLVFTPETYHAIQLGWQAALARGHENLLQEINRFLSLLKEEGIFLVDETHRNVDSLLQANKAEGTPEPIPESQREILLRAYQLMTDTAEVKLTLKDRTVGQVLHLRENAQAQVMEEDKKQALDLVCDRLIDDLEGLPKESLPIIKAFVKDKNLGLDLKLSFESLQEVSFIRGLRQKILTNTLAKVGEMDYGPSVFPDDLVEAPRDQKNPTRAKFESADIAAALTCQAAYQRGVEYQEPMRKMINQMRQEAELERKRSALEPEICKKFREWQKCDSPFVLDEITDADLKDQNFLQEIINRIGKEPEVIADYLRYHALPQVLHFPEKMTSTGADLISGSYATVQFSATLGEKELYPNMKVEQNYWLDPKFLANVSHRACLQHNRELHYFTPDSPKKLLEDLYKKNSSHFDTVEGIIDLGYWSKGHLPKSWAEQFCAFAREKKLDYAGALYFDLNEKGEKKLYFLPKEGKPVQLPSTNLKRELPSLGLKGKRIFKIYGADETTGTDLTLSERAKMIVPIGENTTLSAAAQAVMRMRLFLKNPIDPDKSQSTLWVVPENLRKLIRDAGQREDVEGLFAWITENESTKLKATILSNAIQDIHFQARNYVRELLARTATKEQPELFKKHAACFRYKMPRNPLNDYGLPSQEVKTETYLNGIAEDFYGKANFDKELQMEMLKQVQPIIKAAAELVKMVESQQSNFTATSRQVGYSVQVQKQQQQQQQLQQAQVTGNRNTLWLKEYAKYNDKLMTLKLNSTTNFMPYDDAVIGMNIANLFVGTNVMDTFDGQQISKPISHLLFMEEEGQLKAAAISQDDAIAYLDQIRKKEVRETCKVCLMTPDGNVYQNGKNQHRLDVEKLRQNPWFDEVLAKVNIWNGTVYNQPVIENWIYNNAQEFRAVWNALKARHVNGKNEFDTRTIDRLECKLGKKALQRKNLANVFVTGNAPEKDSPIQEPKLVLPPTIGVLKVEGH